MILLICKKKIIIKNYKIKKIDEKSKFIIEIHIHISYLILLIKIVQIENLDIMLHNIKKYSKI